MVRLDLGCGAGVGPAIDGVMPCHVMQAGENGCGCLLCLLSHLLAPHTQGANLPLLLAGWERRYGDAQMHGRTRVLGWG